MATAGELHPTEGVRLLLERLALEDGGERARYHAAVYTPSEVFEYEAALDAGGGAELEPRGAAAAAEHEKKLVNLARSLARAARRKADDGLDPWPHRVLRWRAD